MSNFNNAVIEYESGNTSVKLSPNIIRNYLVSGGGNVTDTEIVMFLNLCKAQRLNPFLREAYLIKYGNQKSQIVVGKDVFTKRARKNPQCDGYTAGIIVRAENGRIENREGTLLLDNEDLLGGWAEVWIKDYKIPIKGSVNFTEYCQYKDGEPSALWKSKPTTMIRKVALVQCLREAFPEDLQGLYSPEEMPVDVSALDEKPIEAVNSEITQSDIETQSDENPSKEKDYVKESRQREKEYALSTGTNGDNVISEAQGRLLFAKSSKAIVKRIITEFGYESAAAIKKKDFDDILKRITDETILETTAAGDMPYDDTLPFAAE